MQNERFLRKFCLQANVMKLTFKHQFEKNIDCYVLNEVDSEENDWKMLKIQQ